MRTNKRLAALLVAASIAAGCPRSIDRSDVQADQLVRDDFGDSRRDDQPSSPRCSTEYEAPGPPPSQCDNMGDSICYYNWARPLIDGGQVYSNCISNSECTRGYCPLARPASCRCGAGPVCAPNHVCWSPDGDAAAARCVCIRYEGDP